MGGGEGDCGIGPPFPPPIFSLFSPGGAHHSAEAVRRGGTSNSPVCASARRNLHLIPCVSNQRPAGRASQLQLAVRWQAVDLRAHTQDPFYNGAKEIKAMYMDRYGFDYKKANATKAWFNHERLD